jgi:hypothetical protein
MTGETNDADGYHATLDWIHEHGLARRRHKNLVPKIKRRIGQERDPDNLYALKLFLASELRLQDRHSESETVYTLLHDDFPDRPLPLISLASQKLYAEDDPEAALRIIDQAIEVAFRSGDFRRDALGVKGRIALALERYDLVEEVMRQIIPLRTGRGHCDCGMERDILDRLPPGTIDEEVRRQYSDLCRRFEAWVAAGRPRLAQDKQAPSP